MAYRYTKDQRFLKQAQKIAHYILTNKNLPNDDIPYWDYDAPSIPDTPRDVSAAAIMSSAFTKLSRYSNPQNSTRYIKAAGTILNSLSKSPYRAKKVGANHGFLLCKGVVSKHQVENIGRGVPLVYSDYYYIQANLRYLRLIKSKNE